MSDKKCKLCDQDYMLSISQCGSEICNPCAQAQVVELTKQVARAELVTNEILRVVEAHEEKQCIHHGGGLPQRTRQVLQGYANKSADVLSGTKGFRDDLLIYLRATVLNIDSAGHAETHREKNARLRGAVVVLEQFIEELRRMHFDFLMTSYWPRGQFGRSDFPIRELKDRIHTLEAEKEQLAKQIEESQLTPSAG